MKIFLSEINENWIIDRLKNEWLDSNPTISTNKIKAADIVWIISPWMWNKISRKYLKSKKVVCSIYHLEDSDFTKDGLKNFYKRDQYVDLYHVISNNTKKQLQKITDKKIISIPFWLNQKIFYNINNTEELKDKFNINNKAFVIGSFQRDTEGNDLISPKLIKGPDRLLEIYEYFHSLNEHTLILLSGKRRDYIINGLKNRNINYIYFEMVDFNTLNKLYNVLDLYIVASRIEGGPQAIMECAATKTPIISTNVGVAPEILSSESIFAMDNYKKAKPNINYAYKIVEKNFYTPFGFKNFENMFKKLSNN